MKHRFIEWRGSIFIVVGLGYTNCDPPDCYYAVPLTSSIVKSTLNSLQTIRIPFSEAKEITDRKRINAIWILYGE
jgi:hypothetical protein